MMDASDWTWKASRKSDQYHGNFRLTSAIWCQFHQRFTYSFCARRDPESVRTQSSHQYLFTLLGSTSVKAVRRTLMKLSPGLLNCNTSSDLDIFIQFGPSISYIFWSSFLWMTLLRAKLFWDSKVKDQRFFDQYENEIINLRPSLHWIYFHTQYGDKKILQYIYHF